MKRSIVSAVVCVLMTGLALQACREDGMGYVEIKSVPVSIASAPSLYLDSIKLEPLREGGAVLRHAVGTRKLQLEAGGQTTLLCEVVIKKDRITSITVMLMERPPRCQCANITGSDPRKRTCLS